MVTKEAVVEVIKDPVQTDVSLWSGDKEAVNGNGGGPLLAPQNGSSGVAAAQRGGGERLPLDTEDEDQLQCGLGPCSPWWMQIFASKQAFLVTFCVTWVLQGMYYTYFVSVITTIEKLFRLQSKTTGMIMSATEIGQIGSSLLLTYYGGQGHRPRWIACGMVLFAVCCFACATPHFIYGQELLQANDALYRAAAPPVNATFDATAVQPNVCRAPELPMYQNSQLTNHETCEDSTRAREDAHSKITNVVLAIFFVSLLGVGMGQTAVYTLGIPFIDDNVASRESPLYFAITIGVRILGPALGFILGSLCTRLYADLSVTPHITPKDPRWVGAWWLGLVIVSSTLMLVSSAMFMFPKRLGSHRPTTALAKSVEPRSGRRNPSLRDFPKAVKRLLKNDILMFRTASSVLHLLPIAGLYTFLPKYLESQFRLAAHDANLVSGTGGILVMGLGIILSGVFILRVKPNAKFVAGWIAFTAVIYAVGMGILMAVGCPMNDIEGLHETDDGRLMLQPVCNTTCACDRKKFSPICGSDDRTYFSACYAGCQDVTIEQGKVTNFTGCSCMQPNELNSSSATVGYCKQSCHQDTFVLYIMLFSLFVFVHSTSEVGSMLLILRCVDPRDKAMALGLIQFAIGLFGNVPCPIVYGAVVDSTCLYWEDIPCNKKGACWLYNTKVFRWFYHGTTGGIMMCAFLVDIIVWYKAGNINFVDEQVPVQEEELNPITRKEEETNSSKSQITYLAESTA
ncbi:solute carrier organic anion transporter family member 74D [Nilaparvata lugens]|uniref:solute carrier organic anion transporter family member 74D n=1 Tax=Nilaparvata lugens TaxID=108931 RepID=UPI00193E7B6C|nr:solute carrier organic anion transporter family member 74D [Nilaparvata lugens]XP_039279415.1 solute carrier organic anion transporter family member 74D [Nilaparvata lugens]XP_039279423.1 solute carrier organic anion transporter family member 74D [Nilaparvata lugens]